MTTLQNSILHSFLCLSFIFIVGFYAGCGSVKNVEEPDEDTVETDTVATDSSEVNDEDERKAELEEKYKAELREQYKGNANGITTFYIIAQRNFYAGNQKAALNNINKAADIQETADILALRGSIQLLLGNKEQFEENWRRALEMDETVPIPEIPSIRRELIALGLINENQSSDN